jgi:hypothetical protein
MTCNTNIGTRMHVSNTASGMVRKHQRVTRAMLHDTRVQIKCRHAHAWLKYSMKKGEVNPRTCVHVSEQDMRAAA